MDGGQIFDQFNLYTQVSSIPPDVQQCLLTIAQFGSTPDEVKQWYISVREHFGAAPPSQGTSLDDIVEPQHLEQVSVDPQRRVLEWLSPVSSHDWLYDTPAQVPTQLTTIQEADEMPKRNKRRLSILTPGYGAEELIAAAMQAQPKKARHGALPKSKRGANGMAPRPLDISLIAN